MAQSVTLLPKSMVTTPWQFGEELAGFISQGVYRISYQRKTTPVAGQEATGNRVYLTRKGANTNLRAVAETADTWYVRNYNGVMYVIGSFMEDDGKGDNLYNSLGMPYPDGNGPLQDQTGMMPANVILGKSDLGGIIYHPGTGTKYIPKLAGTSSEDNYIVPISEVSLGNIDPVSDAYGWTFEPFDCDVSKEAPSGYFMFNWANNWLRVNELDGNLTTVTIAPNPTNYKSYIWSYSDHKLYNCDSKAINYDPVAPLAKIGTGAAEISFGQVVPTSTAIASPVTLYKGSTDVTVVIMLDSVSKSALNIVKIQGIYIPISMACSANISHPIDSGVEWSVIPIGTSPPASIGPGVYQLKQGKQCIGQDGKLSRECGDSSYWSYDGVSKLQNTKSNQCLINPSTELCNLQDLVVGDCVNPNSARFVMGTDNSLYDPQTGLCYSALVPETYVHNRVRENFDMESSKDWLIPLIFAAVILFVLLVIKLVKRK